MRVPKPKVRAIVSEAVDEIKRNGVQPDVDDILWLAYLAERMVSPAPTDSIEVLSAPVKCGRALLYPRTITGDLWLEQCALQWWQPHKRPFMAALCELYALAHGRDPEAMQAVYTRTSAGIRVRTWAAMNLPVHVRQVQVALDKIAGRLHYVELHDDEIVKERELSPIDWGEEVTLLCSIYRKPPRYFLFELSVNECLGLLKKAAFAIGRPELMDRQADGDDAFGKFRLAVKEIIRKGKDGEES